MKNIKVVQFYSTSKVRWVDYVSYECKKNWNSLSYLQKSLFISAINELKADSLKTRIVNRVKPL
jgi:hypothetical protein